MATLTSILGSDLISNSYPVINDNDQNLNVAILANTASILVSSTVSIGITSVLAQKIQASSSVSSFALTTAATDRVVVWAKGTVSGSTSAGSVALIYNGVTKDSIEVKQAATADQTTFSLMYTEVPGAATANIVTSVIANGALTIGYSKIMVQVIT